MQAKPLACLVALTACLWSSAVPAVAAATVIPPPADVASAPRITADAAVLLDATSGRVLWSRQALQPRAPASTTKMMTALVALERGHLGDVVTVSTQAAATPGSSAHLVAGERFTLGQLIIGLLLPSGNDAAVAIAQHVAGSVPAFAELMNAKAQQLGLQATHFDNPHGLSAPGHYSSALDLALIARAGLAVPDFARVVDTAQAEMSGSDRLQHEVRRELHNTNRLLLTYDWITGVKTGTTRAAGSCLVASASRGGQDLIAVVLHSDDRWGDAMRLLQWGYAHFSYLTPAQRGAQFAELPVALAPDPRATVPIIVGGSLGISVALDELPRVQVTRSLPARLEAPVRRGQVVGTLTLRLDGQLAGEVPLLAGRGVARVGWPWVWWRQLVGG